MNDKNKNKTIQDIKRGIERKNREETDTDGWETVEKKRKKKKELKKESKEIKKQEVKGRDQNNKVKEKRRRPPRTAAVTIKGKDSDFSYADALKRARSEISLQDIGIENTRIRKTVTGGILIQIPGNEGNKKAEILAEKLQKLLEGDARVTLPVIKGELRIIGLDDSVSQQEVREEIARLGACKISDVKAGEIKIMRNGLGFIWIQCPLTVAVKVAECGKIKLGWSVVRVELLKARPKQCFKCWQYGHLRQTCTSDKDYSRLCYKCGNGDHWASACKSDPKCMICKEANKESNHRIGSLACKATQGKKDVNNVEMQKKKKSTQEVEVDRIKEATMDIADD